MVKLSAVQIKRNVLRFMGFDLPDQMLDDVSKIRTDGEKITITTKVAIEPKAWRGCYMGCAAQVNIKVLCCFVLFFCAVLTTAIFCNSFAQDELTEPMKRIQKRCGISDGELMSDAFVKIDACLNRLEAKADQGCQ